MAEHLRVPSESRCRPERAGGDAGSDSSRASESLIRVTFPCRFSDALVRAGDSFSESVIRVARQGFATAPDVSWADVGALDELREELSLSICQVYIYIYIYII